MYHNNFTLAQNGISSEVVGIFSGVEFITSSETNDEQLLGILLNKTCFYGEQGGQEADTGSLVIEGKSEFKVVDVKIFGPYVLHIGYLKYGAIEVGKEVVCTYDEVITLHSIFRNDALL